MHQDLIDVKYVLREVQSMMKVKGERIVRYFDSWIDTNDNIYIEMECCSNNLKNITGIWKKFFAKNNFQSQNRIEYFIYCKIFYELLEAVNYLHQYKPKPIIHRDLKPANILFDDKGVVNGIFFKLCDFGLAIYQDEVSHTRMVGTMKYMAPEVRTI